MNDAANRAPDAGDDAGNGTRIQGGPEPAAPALENGLVILEMLAAADHPIGFNRIAENLTVTRASVVRLLRVLRKAGYVVKDEESGKYLAGPRFAALTPRTAIRESLRRESGPVLESLVDKARNTALVIFWNGRKMICINKVVHQASVPMMEIGTRRPELDEFPWGWLIYSHLTQEEQKAALQAMSDSESFLGKFARRHKTYEKIGYAFDREQIIKSLRRIAAPLYDARGRLVGCLGLGGNPHSLPDEKVETTGKQVAAHAARLSGALGYRPAKADITLRTKENQP